MLSDCTNLYLLSIMQVSNSKNMVSGWNITRCFPDKFMTFCAGNIKIA